jgi:hypothetical protein
MNAQQEPRKHRPNVSTITWVGLGLLLAVSAEATVVLDQEQPVFATDAPTHAIGGSSEQMLSQTVTSGRRGRLVQVDLPVACSESAELIVKITDVDASGRPGSAVLSATTVPGSMLFATDPPAFRSIVLSHPPFIDSGESFAIVLEAEGDSCGLFRGPVGEAYSRGSAFFDARPNPPGWLALKGFRDTPYDLPFKTWVDVPSGGRSGFCSIPTAPPHLGGPGPVFLPFPAWTPLCRCVEDRGIREARCGLFLPDFFLVRELLPPVQGQAAQIHWYAMALTDNPALPRILESPPAGSGLQGQTVDFGANLTAFKPVSRTVAISAAKDVDLEDWTVTYEWPDK